MGDTRGTRTRAAALVVVLTVGLLSSLATSPARAAGGFPAQCVESRAGSTASFVRYPRAVVADLDIEVPWDNNKAWNEVALVNGQPGDPVRDRWILSNQNGPLGGDLDSVVFDDDASLGYYDSIPPGTRRVRIRPLQSIPNVVTTNEQGLSVQVGGGSYQASFFIATVTWSDCDEDSDAVGDRSRDNCVGVYNPAQTDSDGDGLGNECDSTPFPPTPTVTPTTTPTPTGTATDTPTLPPNGTLTPGCTNSCAYARTVGLRHRARKHRLVGTVESVADGCRRTVPVTIWRKRSGADRALVVVTTASSGAFATKAPRRKGRYYATVGSDAQPLCGTARSRVVKVKRR